MTRLELDRRYHNLENTGDESVDMAYLDSGFPASLALARDGTDRPVSQASNRPTLLLLHGLFANGDTWRYLWPHLASRFRLVAPDLVGFGHSSRPYLRNLPTSDRYSVRMFCQHLKQFVVDLDLRRVVLCGHSLGGGLGLYLLIHYPELASRIQGLVLINAAGHPQKLPGRIEELGGWPGTLLDNGPCRWLLRSTGLLTLIVRASIDRTVFQRHHIAAELTPSMVEQLRPPGSLFACRMAARNLLPPNQLETMARVGEIVCPVLIAWGRRDRIVPLEAAGRFQRGLPHSTLQMFEECGHSPHMEEPAEVARAIRIWYDDQVAPRCGLGSGSGNVA